MANLAVTISERCTGGLTFVTRSGSFRVTAALVMMTKMRNGCTLLVLTIRSNCRPACLGGHDCKQQDYEDLSHAADYTK